MEALLTLEFENMEAEELKVALNRIGAQSDGATDLAQAKGTEHG